MCVCSCVVLSVRLPRFVMIILKKLSTNRYATSLAQFSSLFVTDKPEKKKEKKKKGKTYKKNFFTQKTFFPGNDLKSKLVQNN